MSSSRSFPKLTGDDSVWLTTRWGFGLLIVGMVLAAWGLGVGLIGLHHLWLGRVHEEPVLSEYVDDRYKTAFSQWGIDSIDCRESSWEGAPWVERWGKYLRVAAGSDSIVGRCSDPEPFERVQIKKDGGRWIVEVSQIDKSELSAEDAEAIVDQVVTEALAKVNQRAEVEATTRANKASWEKAEG